MSASTPSSTTRLARLLSFACLAAASQVQAGVTLDTSYNTDGVALYPAADDVTAVAHLPRSDLGSTTVLQYTTGCPAARVCVAISQHTDGGQFQGNFFLPTAANFDAVAAAAIDALDRVVIVGTHQASPGNYDFRVMRVLPNGTLDPDFNAGTGLRTYAFDRGGSNADMANAVAIDALDRIVVVGDVERASLNDVDYGVLRITMNGTPDTTFGTDGRVVIPFDLRPSGRTDRATSVAIGANGRILVAGTVKDFDVGINRIGLVRLTATGGYDTTWCNGGCNFNPYSVQSGRRVIFYGLDTDNRDHTVGDVDVSPLGDVVVAGTMRFGGVFNGYATRLAPDGAYMDEATIDGGNALGGATDVGGVRLVPGAGGGYDSLVSGVSGPAGTLLFFTQRLDNVLMPVTDFGNAGAGDSVHVFSATNLFWDYDAQPGRMTIDGRGRVLLSGAVQTAEGAKMQGMSARLTSATRLFGDGFEGDIPIGR